MASTPDAIAKLLRHCELEAGGEKVKDDEHASQPLRAIITGAIAAGPRER